MDPSESKIISSRHHRSRAIVCSIVATGKSRLVINEDKGIFAASMATDSDDNFSLHGIIRHSDTASTSVADISVTDGENGDNYRLLNVPVEVFPYTNPITKNISNYIRFNHPAIKFETSELLIGDRAEIEIQQNLGSFEREIELARPIVHVGIMSIKIVVAQKIEPGFRRESICESSPIPIVEQSEDFMV